MVDVLTKEQRSYNMSMIKSRNTKPEIILRKTLRQNGFRGYRINSTGIYGKPDLIFPKYKIALFIDGCQWHKCKHHYVKPKTNALFWAEKINGNVHRDQIVTKTLKKQGWLVLRIWEHDLKKKDIYKVAAKLTLKLKKRMLDGTIKDT
ncbi:very short patch repair endonuclease [Candidatus Woesearchaeota archaeon]|nr:very short patch repair endonuclease [Candidatus Woesearchaeota archaeon]